MKFRPQDVEIDAGTTYWSRYEPPDGRVALTLRHISVYHRPTGLQIRLTDPLPGAYTWTLRRKRPGVGRKYRRIALATLRGFLEGLDE